MRTRRAFKVKYKAFLIIFKVFSVAKNVLRHESAPSIFRLKAFFSAGKGARKSSRKPNWIKWSKFLWRIFLECILSSRVLKNMLSIKVFWFSSYSTITTVTVSVCLSLPLPLCLSLSISLYPFTLFLGTFLICNYISTFCKVYNFSCYNSSHYHNSFPSSFHYHVSVD